MKYELVVIFKSVIDQKGAEGKLAPILKKEGFTVFGIEWWGKKPLAYEIRKQKEANYLSCEIEGTAKNPNNIYTTFKLDDSILRALVLKKEEDRKISNPKSQ